MPTQGTLWIIFQAYKIGTMYITRMCEMMRQTYYLQKKSKKVAGGEWPMPSEDFFSFRDFFFLSRHLVKMRSQSKSVIANFKEVLRFSLNESRLFLNPNWLLISLRNKSAVRNIFAKFYPPRNFGKFVWYFVNEIEWKWWWAIDDNDAITRVNDWFYEKIKVRLEGFLSRFFCFTNYVLIIFLFQRNNYLTQMYCIFRI